MNYNFDMHGVPDETTRVAATDVAQNIAAALYTNENNNPAIALLITCETNMIRFCLGGSVPTQGAAGAGHILYVGQSLRLSSARSIRSFQFINHTNGANAFLQVTPEYEIGDL
jgi:hypothetical protein